MLTVPAYAATSATDPLSRSMIERRELGPNDVLIAIRYAGICHSDIHTVRSEWRSMDYPLVVGHEIAGEVQQIGSEVTNFAVGDRVGVGCMVNSCRECKNCQSGNENYCQRGSTQTYGSVDRDGTVTQGGYSTHIVVDKDFVLRLPESIPYEAAAPLLCAGITTYSPLAHWNVGPGTKVAVIGMGGLGHLAVKIAAAMGAEVTVLSQSLAKQDDGFAFGAKHYVATSDGEAFKSLRESFDLILNTVSVNLNLDRYLGLLSLDGTWVNLGVPVEPLSLSAFSLLRGRRSISGSLIGSIAETQEMLDFCAEHGIATEVEVIGVDEINEAYDRVVASDVRYRFVIDTTTF